MRRLNIGIDVDDALADFVNAFVTLARAMFDKPANWEWSDSGLTPAQIDEVWEQVKRTRNFWENLRVTDDAGCNALLKLASHRLFFIAARALAGVSRVKDLNEFVSLIQKENNASSNR